MNIAPIEDDWTKLESFDRTGLVVEPNEFLYYENEILTDYIIIFTDEMLDEI